MKAWIIYATMVACIICIAIYDRYTFTGGIEPFHYSVPETYTLPKQIWSFWDTGEMPADIQAIYNKNKSTLYDWKFVCLSDDTISDYLDMEQFPPGYYNLIPQHRADYIRLALLYKYGGVWMDVSIIVNSREAFNKLYDGAVERKVQAALFTLGDRRPDPSYVENWLIIAPAKSAVVGAWHHEYGSAVRISLSSYERYVWRKGFRINSRIYMPYLTQHVCMQVILQKYPELVDMIVLHSSEESMFYVQNVCKWEAGCIKEWLGDSARLAEVPYIKMRGVDRDHYRQANTTVA